MSSVASSVIARTAMIVLLAVVALVFSFAADARAQADTVRRARIRGVQIRSDVRTSDLSRYDDIETVEVIKPGSASMFFDRIGAAGRRSMLDTLEAQRQLWRDRRPRTYLIRVIVRDGCIRISTTRRRGGTGLWNQLVVRDSTVVKREPAPIAGDRRACPRDWQIDDLFADLATAIADTTAHIGHVRYDEIYGFPRSYRVDRGMHRDADVIVESFAPVSNRR